jgi:hypothetical protein
LDLKGRKMDRGKNYIIMNFIASILHGILLGWLNQGGEVVGTGTGMERGEIFTGFWLGGPKGRGHCEDLAVGGRITLRWTLGR